MFGKLEILVFSCLFAGCLSFISRIHQQKTPHTIHYYNYFKRNKDGEKKDVGRLWKNIIFPGIYSEYEDTKEPLKTVVIQTKTTKKVDRTASKEAKSALGKYNVVDEATVPKTVSLNSIKKQQLKAVKKPESFVAPIPKLAAKGKGLSVIPEAKRVRLKKPIIIYDDEANGECRRVREALSMLDLPVEFRPCPGSRYGFSDQMATVSLGRREVPFMIDENPSMYRPRLSGANDILDHLFTTYGAGEDTVPKNLQKKGSKSGGKFNSKARPDVTKLKPITVYGFEGAPYVKPVREALNSLALAHVFINCANGSANREKLTKITKGVFQVPYIVDPNTGVSMFESKEIVKYLEETYTV